LAYSSSLNVFVLASFYDETNEMCSLWYSSDLITFSKGTNTFKNYAQVITWNGSMFIACGAKAAPVSGDYGEGPVLLWSSDGINWNDCLSNGQLVYSQLAMDAKYNGTQWIAIGSNAPFLTNHDTNQPIYTSLDGKNWTLAEGQFGIYNSESWQNSLGANAICVKPKANLRGPDIIAHSLIKQLL
jgi:hypothetical protein